MSAFITIGGKKLTLIWSEIDDYGSYFHDAGTIVLRSDLKDNPIEALNTLRHELMHAALAISGVGFGLDDEKEEQVVRCMDGIFFPAWEHLLEQGWQWGRKAEKRRSGKKATPTQRKRTRKA
jgi:hypothetical protein